MNTKCDWQTAYGLPWSETCGLDVAEGDTYCSDHESDMRELYPSTARRSVVAQEN